MSAVFAYSERIGRVTLLVSLLALTLTACGGSSGSGGDGNGNGGGLVPPPPPPPPPPAPEADVGGLWFGTFELDGEGAQPAEGIVAEDGRFHFNINHGEGQLYGQFSVAGNIATADATAVVILGSGDDEEEVAGAGTLELEVTSRGSLEGTFTLDLGAIGQGQGTVSLEYDPLYDRGASLADIAGTYQDTDDPTDVFTISETGVFFQQSDTEFNCVLNGQFSVVDPEFNAYVLAADVSNCVGELAVLNGNDVNGLFFFDDTVTPVMLVGGIHVEVASIDAVIAIWTTSERP